MFVLDVNLGKVESLAFGPDSRSLAVPSAERGLLLWSDPLESSQPRTLCLPQGSPAGSVRFSIDGSWIEWRGYNALAVFDATSGERVAFVQPTIQEHLNFTAALVKDGTSLLVSRMISSDPRAFQTQFERIPLSNPRSEAAAWSVTVAGVVWDDAVFLPDGCTFLLIVHRGKGGRNQWESVIVGRDLGTGQQLWSSLPSDAAPRFPTLSRDGRHVAAWASTFFTVWRTGELDQKPVRIKNEGKRHFTAIAFHPSGKYLAATSNDATVKLYDIQSWQIAQAFAWKTGRARSVAFSPDGCRGAVGSDKGQVILWDVDV